MATSLLLALALTPVTTDLTFVRHGETLANATGKYNSKTIDTFSPKGEQQVKALTQKLLKEKRYDVILVSPSPRALKTIAPYLKSTNQQAYIWPLLYECCTQKRPSDAHPTRFTYGSSFKAPSTIATLFQIGRYETKLPSAPDYNAGLAQIDETLKVFRLKYAGKRVLIVGHSGHGGQFLKGLTGKFIRLENATPMHFVLTAKR